MMEESLLGSASNNVIDIYQGESADFLLTIDQLNPSDGATSYLDLTGAVLWFTVKPQVKTREILIQKSSADATQIEIHLPLEGKALLHLNPTDTARLACKSYYYDVWVVLPSGKRYIAIKPTQFIVHAGLTELAL